MPTCSTVPGRPEDLPTWLPIAKKKRAVFDTCAGSVFLCFADLHARGKQTSENSRLVEPRKTKNALNTQHGHRCSVNLEARAKMSRTPVHKPRSRRSSSKHSCWTKPFGEKLLVGHRNGSSGGSFWNDSWPLGTSVGQRKIHLPSVPVSSGTGPWPGSSQAVERIEWAESLRCGSSIEVACSLKERQQNC